jgi:hypothetical protein
VYGQLLEKADLELNNVRDLGQSITSIRPKGQLRAQKATSGNEEAAK